VVYLSLKGLNAVEIQNDLVATLKDGAKSNSIVMHYLRKSSFSSPKTPQSSESPNPILNESDEAILLALSDEPFASMRQLARRTHLHPSTVYDHLRYKFGVAVRYLHWVPHLLWEADKYTRAQLSFELFEILQHQKDMTRHDIVTIDESWFYLTTDHQRIWLPEETEGPERERISFQSRKMMVTIIWNPTRLCRIVALPKGMKFNADYYISHILDPLAEWPRSQVGGSNRGLHVRAENARPHTAKKATEFLAGNGMKRTPHPPYSPDLAPRDFYYFRT
jgi:histone-lysine N-methyltransferase SETMAR